MIIWHIIAIVLIFWIGWIFGRRMQNEHHWHELNALRHYYERKRKTKEWQARETH
jgi:hypothetical protein|tara:strand:- start:268 stop:432 length:165 start_codon:yes stop_codon:yes gene_type:complete